MTAGEGIYIRVKNNIADLMIFDDEALFYFLYPALTIGEYVTLEPEDGYDYFSLDITENKMYALFALDGDFEEIVIYDDLGNYLNTLSQSGNVMLLPGRYIIQVSGGEGLSFMFGMNRHMVEAFYEKIEIGTECDVSTGSETQRIVYFVPEKDGELKVSVSGAGSGVKLIISDTHSIFTLTDGTDSITWSFTKGECYMLYIQGSNLDLKLIIEET